MLFMHHTIRKYNLEIHQNPYLRYLTPVVKKRKDGILLYTINSNKVLMSNQKKSNLTGQDVPPMIEV